MNTQEKYKHILAFVLLALYFFVTTPVQFWHHHNYTVAVNAKALHSSSEKEDLSVFKLSGSAKDDNCQICSHQYSVYNDTCTTPEIVPGISKLSREPDYLVSIPSSPLSGLSNKGPPSLS